VVGTRPCRGCGSAVDEILRKLGWGWIVQIDHHRASGIGAESDAGGPGNQPSRLGQFGDLI